MAQSQQKTKRSSLQLNIDVIKYIFSIFLQEHDMEYSNEFELSNRI